MKGIEVHVLAPHDDKIPDDEFVNGVYVHRFKYFWPTSLQSLAYLPGIPENIKTFRGKLQVPFFIIGMMVRLLEIVTSYRVEIINAHWATPSGFSAVITKFIHHRPVLITVYGDELYTIAKGHMKPVKAVTRYVLSNADKVVGISDAACNAARQIADIREIEVLPDGIDTSYFNPNINCKLVIEKYGLHGKKLIFSSGRMVERKGFIYLIRAMPTILKKHPDAILIIGGDGPERERLEKEVKRLNLEGKVIMPGFISEKEFPMHMKAAEVFVLPSIVDKRGGTEGSATILLEAMACGTPVVGTNVGGIPYGVKDGIGGFLVEPENPEALAEKIIFLLSNPKVKEEMGVQARRYVEENFDWIKIADRYIEIFKELTLKS